MNKVCTGLAVFLVLASACATVAPASPPGPVVRLILGQSQITVDLTGDSAWLQYGELIERTDDHPTSSPEAAATAATFRLQKRLDMPVDHSVAVPGRIGWTVGSHEKLTVKFDTRQLTGDVVVTFADGRPPLKLSPKNPLGFVLVTF